MGEWGALPFYIFYIVEMTSPCKHKFGCSDQNHYADLVDCDDVSHFIHVSHDNTLSTAACLAVLI